MSLRLYSFTASTKRSTASQRGQLLIIATIFLAVLFIIAFSLSFAVTRSSATIKKTNYEKKSLNVAEAGIQKAISILNTNFSYSGETNTSFGDGQFTVSVSTLSSTSKQIDATAYIPNSANPIAVKHLRANAIIDATMVAFTYGVQIGEGGLLMRQNTKVDGSVYSNGNIVGENNSVITGDAYVAAGVESNANQAHDVCAGSTPPATCQNYDIGYTIGSEKRDDVAQKFMPTTNKNLVKASLYVKKSSASAPSDATIKIVEDDSGNPAGATVATGTLSGSSVGTTYSWIDVGFSSNPPLTDTKHYWIVFDSNGNYTSANHFIWSYDNNAEGNYAQGKGVYGENFSNKPIYNINNNSTGDLGFKIWLGSGTTGINGVIVRGDAHAHSIANSKICGNAYYFETSAIDSSSLNFLNDPTHADCDPPLPDPPAVLTPGANYQPTADPVPQAMPLSDANISDWEQNAVNGGTKTCTGGVYTPANNESIGPVKIPCDLNVTGGDTVIIGGPVWVAGDIILGNNAIIKLAPAFGALSTSVVADDQANPTIKGVINVGQGVKICGSAGYDSANNRCYPSNGSYIMFLSTHKNSVTNGIILQNTSDGAIFYTSQSRLEVQNNSKAKQITGWGIELKNNAEIKYEIGLSSSAFTSGPGASWTVADESWSEIP